jgi:hypothetical protein
LHFIVVLVLKVKQIDILKVKTYLMKSKESRSLETKFTLEILGNLTHKTLEWKLADEEVGGLLVPTDLTKGNSSWTITMGLLDTSSDRGRLTCSLGCKLLTGGFASGGLTGGLFGSGHC